MKHFFKSDKLSNVCYDIRGPVLEEANRMEEEGIQITKLNIGNPPVFGFTAPDEILRDFKLNLNQSQAYGNSKGLFSARKAIMQYFQTRGVLNVDTDQIYLGNGVSELIVMAMQGLLNNGDEVLIPAPDYPLWSAAVNLSGGSPVHYVCDEESDWYPDLEDIRKKISDRTVAIVVINPNNPTGAVYNRDILKGILELAEENNLLVFSDEIYDQIIYDEEEFVPMAILSGDYPVITMGGLSKSHRIPGFRVGWMVLTGKLDHLSDYIEGLNVLSGMRLCANVPSQQVIQTALGGYQSLRELILPGGRLYEQRNLAFDLINDIPGITCVKPKGTFYIFPKVDFQKFKLKDDRQMVLDLLLERHILIVQGTGFNWFEPDHFRVVFLPNTDELREALHKMKNFFEHYAQ